MTLEEFPATGTRFRIASARGSQYCVMMLRAGEEKSGLYVRLEDGRIARLDANRLDWETLEELPGDGEKPIRLDDEVLLETSSGTIRGTLARLTGGEIGISLPIGGTVQMPSEEVSSLSLLFRARDVRPGDRICVSSKSGNEYQGLVRALSPGRLLLQLTGGGNANLRLTKIDLSTLFVLVELPRELLLAN